jgi:hypothetical protein
MLSELSELADILELLVVVAIGVTVQLLGRVFESVLMVRRDNLSIEKLSSVLRPSKIEIWGLVGFKLTAFLSCVLSTP